MASASYCAGRIEAIVVRTFGLGRVGDRMANSPCCLARFDILPPMARTYRLVHKPLSSTAMYIGGSS